MSLNGIAGSVTTIYQPTDATRTRVEQDRAQTAVTQQESVRTPKAVGAGLLAPRHEVLPAEAPEGTDPELWQVLTSEERSHFARMSAMGPLTYGRPVYGASEQTNASEPGMRRGGRIDVRA